MLIRDELTTRSTSRLVAGDLLLQLVDQAFQRTQRQFSRVSRARGIAPGLVKSLLQKSEFVSRSLDL
jgi:hypothetical protein